MTMTATHDVKTLLPPFPKGWYALGLGRDLRAGDLRPLTFMGQNAILYRSAAGHASVMGAYCPHLGAHLGYGGVVKGENVQCPFHKFEFDRSGRCVSIPYETRIPPKARAVVFPTVERSGFVFAYADPLGQPPAWALPTLDTAGWSPLLTTAWTLRGHPQETTENSVDIGHFAQIHGYSAVEMLRPLVTDGPYLTTKYAMRRLTSALRLPVRSEFEIHVYGLGYSQVDVEVPAYGIRARLFVLPTPLDGERITLRIAVSLAPGVDLGRVHPLLRIAPPALIRPLIARGIFGGLRHDVEQDIPIWQHKQYVQPPILAEGDGPVGRYRQWVKQFYADPSRV